MTPIPEAPRNILIVCTGNTCRSPLAAALLRQKLATRGVQEIAVGSAGTGAWDGVPASEGAYLVGLEAGIDLSSHRSRLLTADLVGEADLILSMSRQHLARIAALGGEGKGTLLGEYAGRAGNDAEVSDPFGLDLDAYRATFAALDTLLDEVADRLATQGGGRSHAP